MAASAVANDQRLTTNNSDPSIPDRISRRSSRWRHPCLPSEAFMAKIQRAILSVDDKTGLVDFPPARGPESS